MIYKHDQNSLLKIYKNRAKTPATESKDQLIWTAVALLPGVVVAAPVDEVVLVLATDVRRVVLALPVVEAAFVVLVSEITVKTFVLLLLSAVVDLTVVLDSVELEEDVSLVDVADVVALDVVEGAAEEVELVAAVELGSAVELAELLAELLVCAFPPPVTISTESDEPVLSL